jgi:hypothetical protein
MARWAGGTREKMQVREGVTHSYPRGRSPVGFAAGVSFFRLLRLENVMGGHFVESSSGSRPELPAGQNFIAIEQHSQHRKPARWAHSRSNKN